MKMTVQLYPNEDILATPVVLDIDRDGNWTETASTVILESTWTAHFRLEGWDSSRDAPYRVRHGEDSFAGLIRRDPANKNEIVAAAFTGNSPGPGGGMISKRDVVENVSKVDPDVLIFTGDQVYRHQEHTKHWIRFGETFRDIIRNRPTITIPDDHDVGHPNLWGAGGRHARRDTDGGYLKPPEYVNMVQAQQTSHLPDPYDPEPVEQGITVYYTSLNVGGIDFAILEDRKWKSGCEGLVPPELGRRPDHVSVSDYDPAMFDVPGKVLMGERQLRFLEQWGQDWDGAVMKVVVSQTPLANASTHHAQQKEFYYADLDSNGWPQTGRNKAVAAFRRCYALHICGDQHLATILHYGLDAWRDSGFAFAVPSIANLWPRWWEPMVPGKNPEPGAREHTGDFLDGFGNRITVHAHTNPYKTGREPAELHDRMPGFGVIRFDKKRREMTLECWPRMTDPTSRKSRQYPDWPRKIHQYDNYARKAYGYLPELRIRGASDPVVQVVDESSGEVLYTLRIQGKKFSPKVFKPGSYTLRVKKGGFEKAIPGLKPGQGGRVKVTIP